MPVGYLNWPFAGRSPDGVVHILTPSLTIPDDRWRTTSYAAYCQNAWIDTSTDELAKQNVQPNMVVDCMACLAKVPP